MHFAWELWEKLDMKVTFEASMQSHKDVPERQSGAQ